MDSSDFHSEEDTDFTIYSYNESESLTIELLERDSDYYASSCYSTGSSDLKPFDDITKEKSGTLAIIYKFNVDTKKVNERMYNILEKVWYHIYFGEKCNRRTIFNGLVAIGLDIKMYEMEELRKYIKVDVQFGKKVYEGDEGGGVKVKTVLDNPKNNQS